MCFLVCIILEGMHKENKKHYGKHQWLMASISSSELHSCSNQNLFFLHFKIEYFASFS